MQLKVETTFGTFIADDDRHAFLTDDGAFVADMDEALFEYDENIIDANPVADLNDIMNFRQLHEDDEEDAA